MSQSRTNNVIMTNTQYVENTAQTVTAQRQITRRSVTGPRSLTLSQTDYLIDCNTTGGVITITLPVISVGVPSVNNPTSQLVYRIIDTSGNAGQYNITILPGSGNTVQGSTSVLINQNNMSLTLTNNGNNNWFII